MRLISFSARSLRHVHRVVEGVLHARPSLPASPGYRPPGHTSTCHVSRAHGSAGLAGLAGFEGCDGAHGEGEIGGAHGDHRSVVPGHSGCSRSVRWLPLGFTPSAPIPRSSRRDSSPRRAPAPRLSPGGFLVQHVAHPVRVVPDELRAGTERSRPQAYVLLVNMLTQDKRRTFTVAGGRGSIPATAQAAQTASRQASEYRPT